MYVSVTSLKRTIRQLTVLNCDQSSAKVSVKFHLIPLSVFTTKWKHGMGGDIHEMNVDELRDSLVSISRTLICNVSFLLFVFTCPMLKKSE